MLISGIILLIGELYKQLMNFYVVNDHVYDWWIFPFQLCSLPMYLCPLLIMIHNEKRHRILCTFLLDFNMMGAVATFIDPPVFSSVLDADTAWHPLASDVDFSSDSSLFCSHEADLTTRGFLQTLPLFAFFCLAAEVLNGILHRFSAANLFYISPWEMSTSCSLAISIGYLAVPQAFSCTFWRWLPALAHFIIFARKIYRCFVSPPNHFNIFHLLYNPRYSHQIKYQSS